MRSKSLAAAAALAAALGLAQPAAASILYDFSFTNLSDGFTNFTLHYEAASYIVTTGLAPVTAQPTSLGYDVLNFGENKIGWFLFSNTGGVLDDTTASYSLTSFLFTPNVVTTSYITAPGVYVGRFGGNADGGSFGGDGALTITDTAPPGGGTGVPEPAAWALMILGFALIGATLRRDRPVTV